MVRRWRHSIRALRNHSCPGDISHDLCSWKMTTDSRLCSLAHLDLNGGSSFKIASPDSESTGSHLDYGVASIFVEILMESTLSCVVEGADFFRSLSQG